MCIKYIYIYIYKIYYCFGLRKPGCYIFGDYYRVNRDYRVKRDYYRVNKDCARIHNQASAGEAVSSTISKASATPFSVTITESTGIVRIDKSRHQLGKQFWWWFSSWKRLIVADNFWVNSVCLRWPIPTSAVEGVELIISESSTTLLSVTITESIWTARAYETKLQLGKQFRRRFPCLKRLRFRWRLSSQPWLPIQEWLLPSQ